MPLLRVACVGIRILALYSLEVAIMPARSSPRRKLLAVVRQNAIRLLKRMSFRRVFRTHWRQLQIEILCERKLMAANIAAVRPDTGHPNDLLSFYLDTEPLRTA